MIDPEKIGPVKITVPGDRGVYLGTGILNHGALTLDGVHQRTWHIDGEPVPYERRAAGRGRCLAFSGATGFGTSSDVSRLRRGVRPA
jgi:hypothetical protein